MDKDNSLHMKKVQKPEAVWAQVCSDHNPDEECLLLLAQWMVEFRRFILPYS